MATRPYQSSDAGGEDSLLGLGVPSTSLIGRDHDLARLLALLERADARIVTLTGPGGIGKTRLALAAVAAYGNRWGTPILVRSLAAVTDPDLVLPEVALAVGLRERDVGIDALPERIGASLQGNPTLLLLDNLEQVAAAGPGLATLVAAAPDLRLLTTSRIALRVRPEREFPVSPLPVPDSDAPPSPEAVAASAAVRLLVDAAARVGAEIAVDAANAADIADICARLDGLPLAIELAASSLAVLSPAALRSRLERRLTVLTSGPRDLPDRQRTLRDTIAWSYHLLDPAAQRGFRSLAVFAGGIPVEAAEATLRALDGPPGAPQAGTAAAEPLDRLTSLVDHCLLRPEPDGAGARLGMLETIREFARERLAEQPEDHERAQAAHAAWFLDFAELADAALLGPEQERWLARIEAENANMASAFSWLLAAGPPDAALRLATARWRAWEIEGRLTTARADLEQALAAGGGRVDLLRARALINLGNVLLDLGHLAEAEARYEASLDLRRQLGDETGEADSLNNLGLAAAVRGDLDAARRFHEASLAIRTRRDDRWGIALSVSNLGDVANAEGDYGRAWDLQAEALALRKALGEPRAIAYSQNNLGESALGRRDLPTAIDRFTLALDMLRAVGDRSGTALALRNRGRAFAAAGDLSAARADLLDAVVRRSELRDAPGVAQVLGDLAALLYAAGDAPRTARLLAAATRFHAPVTEGLAPLRTAARAALGGDRFEREWRQGQLLDGPAAAADAAAATMPEHRPGSEPGQRGTGRGRDPLTGRERAVLTLLAEGKSDREIGQALFVTTRTASTHVANILRKLDLPSRAAAAAWAVRQHPRPSEPAEPVP